MRYRENNLVDDSGTPVIKTFISSVPRGKREYREHFHAECELSTFLSGSGVYTIKGKTYRFQAGDVFVFAGNEAHCITEITEKFEVLNLHFLPSVLLRDGGELDLLKIFFARSEKFNNKIDPENPATKVLHGLICDIANELEQKEAGYKTKARCNLFCAFVSLIRDYGYIDKAVSYQSSQSTVMVIDKARRFIDDNLGSSLTLNQIASVTNMAPTYFSAVFKQINGVSPWKYITIKRVEKAIYLIKTTDMTKLDIAAQCGFTSSSNFYKAFFQVTGKKPSDYT